jgi:general transcription factor 3C polypeptide 4
MEPGDSCTDPPAVLATNVSHTKSPICEADDRTITGLSFVEHRDMKVRLERNILELKHKLIPIQPIVIIFRPGVVQLWTEESDECAWSGLRTLYLYRQDISTGSSMHYPPSGFMYSQEHDAIVLSLFDGTLHVLHDISSSPTVRPSMRSTEQSGFSSSDLSSVSRRIFIQIEGGAIPQEEMNRINGMASFGGFPIVCWAHE